MNELHIANGPEGIKARIDTIFRKLPYFMPWIWELIALAKAEGIEITKDEAEAYLDELHNIELDQEKLEKVAGGMKIVVIKTCDNKLSLPRPGYD